MQQVAWYSLTGGLTLLTLSLVQCCMKILKCNYVMFSLHNDNIYTNYIHVLDEVREGLLV